MFSFFIKYFREFIIWVILNWNSYIIIYLIIIYFFDQLIHSQIAKYFHSTGTVNVRRTLRIGTVATTYITSTPYLVRSRTTVALPCSWCKGYDRTLYSHGTNNVLERECIVVSVSSPSYIIIKAGYTFKKHFNL
jgi:hypothetical protein